MMRKKSFKKWMAAGLAVCIFALSAKPVTAEAAQWKKDSIGWWYQQDDGSYPANQWKQIGGQWYYFKANGYMATGWLWNGSNWYYMGSDGAMRTGWQNIAGTYYYMYADGRMASNTYIGEYFVDSSGAWVSRSVTGTWKQEGDRWWYCHGDGSYTVSDWEQINGKWYYFDAEGWMLSDQWIGDYYVGADGAMVTDQWIDELYYVDSTGKWDPNMTCQDKVYIIDLGNGKSTTVEGHFDPTYAAQVVTLLNQYRQANGLGTLDTSDIMTTAANTRSYEISYYFDHTRPNGTSCFSLLENKGYWGMGENIASGFSSPEAVMAGWKSSPGHNANMLTSTYTNVGVGVFAEKKIGINGKVTYYYHWVQLFSY
ncbi:MAG: CAP domain-containing protein [Roseburia sp.]